MTRHDVALIVAHVNTVAGRQAQATGGFEQRLGVRFGVGRGVATDNSGRITACVTSEPPSAPAKSLDWVWLSELSAD